MTDATTESRRLTYGFIARAALVVIAVYALAQALWLIRDIAFIGFASILLAAFFSIFIDRLQRLIPRWIAAVLTLLVFLALSVGFWIVAWPQLEGQVATLVNDVPRIISAAVDWLRDHYRALMPMAPGSAEEVDLTLQQRLQGEAMNIVAGALPLLNTAIGTVTGVLITLFSGFFLALDPDVYLDRAVRLLPPSARPRVRDAVAETGGVLKRWIGGTSISMVIIFTTTTIGLWLLGIPAALVLGMIAGLLVFIPFIGPTLSAIPAMAMALTVSPTMVLWVGVLYFGIQQVESNLLTPVVMREAVRLEPAATLLFQMAMGVLFGFLGLFLAVPLLAAAQLLVKRLYVDRLEA